MNLVYKTLGKYICSSFDVSIISVSEVNRGAPVTFNNGVIHGIMSLQDVQSNVTHRLKLAIEWENDERYNNEDTEIGTAASTTV